jgi:hypothetical protein
MKTFQQFISESVTIHGDFNGTLNVGGDPVQQKVDEQNQYIADVVWMGKIYRMEVEGSMMSKNELAEELQGEYPGAIVHNIYPSTNQSIQKLKMYRDINQKN